MTLADIFRARRRIAGHVRRTPLMCSSRLSEAAGTRVSLKLESLQVTHSFKARGAFNAVIARRERSQNGIGRLVTASAGNHGRGLAMAAQTFGTPLVVYTPAAAPRSKVDAIRQHKATLVADACDYDAAESQAKAYASGTGADFVSPYNDLDVIEGAGTVALEIFEDAPDADVLIVPIGGGGLVSGVGVATKAIHPECRVVGVEVEASCPFQTSIRAGRLVRINPRPTLADALCGNPDPETVTFSMIQRYVDDIVTVSEDDLAKAIVGLTASEHLVVEAGGAVGAAAVLDPSVHHRARHAVVIITGGNIDSDRLAELLE